MWVLSGGVFSGFPEPSVTIPFFARSGSTIGSVMGLYVVWPRILAWKPLSLPGGYPAASLSCGSKLYPFYARALTRHKKVFRRWGASIYANSAAFLSLHYAPAFLGAVSADALLARKLDIAPEAVLMRGSFASCYV